MQDDEPKVEKRYPLSASKMSKTPSWIMLGFLLGAGFVITLPPLRKRPAPPPAAFRAVDPPRPTEPREPPVLTTIEAVFAEWGRLASWTDDVTEVALWNSRTKGFTDFYEVRRSGGNLYFRTIDRLTRRVIARGKPIPESPLQFTETEEQYQEWQQHGRAERLTERDLRPLPNVSTRSPVAPRVEGVKLTPPVLEQIIPALEPPPSGVSSKK